MESLTTALQLVRQQGRFVDVTEEHERFDLVADEGEALRPLDATLDRIRAEELVRGRGIADRQLEESEDGLRVGRVGAVAGLLAQGDRSAHARSCPIGIAGG